MIDLPIIGGGPAGSAACAIACLGPRLVEGTRWRKVPPPCCIQFPTVKQIEHVEGNQ